MRISIATRLKPFSHRPGTRCLIPFTTWEVQIYPTKLFFQNLAGPEKEVVSLSIKGPVSGFTIVQDLEKGRLEVFGKGAQGFFTYFISPNDFTFLESIPLPPTSERLSLGVHKKQDWELVQRRSLMEEIFPFWLRLSQIIPKTEYPSELGGTYAHLKKLIEKDQIVSHFKEVFHTGFQDLLTPRLFDENHLGILPSEENVEGYSPLPLLHEGAKQIRAQFFIEEGDTWHILPKLAKEFHSGRFINVKTQAGDELNMEWSKKEIKKVVIHPSSNHTIHLQLQKGINSFRLRKSKQDKGITLSRDSEINLRIGETLFLDHFFH